MAKVVKQKKEVDIQFSLKKKSRFSDYVKLNKEYFGTHPSTFAEEYKKQPKKPKKLAKWIVNLMVICSVIILVIVSSVVCSVFAGGTSGGYVSNGKDNVHNFLGLAIAPTIDNSEKIDISSFNDDSKLIAEYLYNLSSQKITDAAYFTAYNKGLTYMRMGSSDNYIDVDAVTMKTQNEYFNIEYHLKNSVPILDTFIGEAIAKTTDVITTVRQYASTDDQYMTYQKVKNNEYSENGVPYAQWDSEIPISIPVEKQLPIPVYNSNQEGTFYMTKHIITADTISVAEIKHNNEEGFYSISVVLDHTNPDTIINSIHDIRAGTGDKNANYTSIQLDFSVWDSGYLRTFSMIEKWEANIVISLNFRLETNWICSYNKQDCNMNKYPDAKSMKEYLGK